MGAADPTPFFQEDLAIRNIAPIAVCLCCLGAAWLAHPVAAPGQTTLKQLQQQIRNRAGHSAAPRPPEGGKPTTVRQPVYLGLIADDTNDRGRGVRVVEVAPGGPAAMGGLVVGDLITALAGVRIRQMSDIRQVVGLFPPGQRLVFEVLRDGKRQRLEVTLGRRGTAPAPTSTGPEVIPLPPAKPLAEEPLIDGPQLVPPKTDEGVIAKQPTIEQLLSRIKELENRIEELERALAERP